MKTAELLARMAETHVPADSSDRVEARRGRVLSAISRAQEVGQHRRFAARRRDRQWVWFMAAALTVLAAAAFAEIRVLRMHPAPAEDPSPIPHQSESPLLPHPAAPRQAESKPLELVLEPTSKNEPLADRPKQASARPVQRLSLPERPAESARVADPVDEVPQTPVSSLAEENRRFQQAMQARRESGDARAIVLLDAFLRQFPRSVLAHEARVERSRAEQRMGNRAAATSSETP